MVNSPPDEVAVCVPGLDAPLHVPIEVEEVVGPLYIFKGSYVASVLKDENTILIYFPASGIKVLV